MARNPLAPLQALPPDFNPLTGRQPTEADAWEANTQAYQNWVAAQRADGIAKGLLDPQTGWPTQAGLQDAGQQYASALLAGTTTPGLRAFHGSPHAFDQFQLSKIGTGEGNQAYGHGLYFAENEGVARTYRQIGAPAGQGAPAAGLANQAAQKAADAGLTGDAARSYALTWLDQQSKPVQALSPQHYYDAINNFDALTGGAGAHGHMYEVNINADPAHFLDWDKPLSAQSPHVQDALKQFGIEAPSYTVRQTPDGHVVDYVAKDGTSKTSRPFATPEQADSAGQATAQMGGIKGFSGTGGAVYEHSALAPGDYRDPVTAAQRLQDAGIPGIRYLDGGSRADGTGTSNYVVFHPGNIEIMRKYGISALMAGGGAAAAAAQPDPTTPDPAQPDPTN